MRKNGDADRERVKNTKTKSIKVENLARIEGEGALDIKIKGGRVADLKLRVYEPPRFFEAFLRGREYKEVPDITARICGICPVAYQMSSAHAIEDAFGIKVDGALRDLRRLIYCGEWIESHALHIYMLHAPDFLGYDDVLKIAQDYPDIVNQGLRLKKIGNQIVTLVGGREIHPVNVCVGGFYRTPDKKALLTLMDDLKWAIDASCKTSKWAASLDFPDFERDFEFVALRHPDEYPLNEGRIVSNKGLDISVNEYEGHFIEEQVDYSNALHSVINGSGDYSVGPLARFNLNFDKLTPLAQEAAKESGIPIPCRNPFMSIIARSIELLYACEEALRIIENYEPPEKPRVDVCVKAGKGYGCSEAPRGILYHSYQIGVDGLVESAKIVPPTAQNQKCIERDLLNFVPSLLDLSTEEATYKCEQAIRNYDPCISCATHFLKLNIEYGS
ncbi:MAG: Ni/Fe hydrogenase subunit alpha [Actinobacteria bacterium]|nr:Ni/Fe hydrogenase subunit alpha [Actinomycetota bacterium]